MSETDPPRPSTTVVFPITELEREMVDLIPRMPPPPRWPAFNAVRHLNQAWRLKTIDHDMMILRLITAEEEAAAALFKSLQRRKYEGAEKLKSRQHIFKNAVMPFINAVGRVFADLAGGEPDTHLFFNKSSAPPQFQLRMKAGELTDGRIIWATSKPLHFSLSLIKPGAEKVTIDFSEQLAQIASEANAKSVRKYLEERATLRNKLLYAVAEGYYAISGDMDEIFRYYQRNVFVILQLYLMIDPYEQRQEFAQQCLHGVLKILTSAPKEHIFE
jgi:hypothetical protein